MRAICPKPDTTFFGEIQWPKPICIQKARSTLDAVGLLAKSLDGGSKVQKGVFVDFSRALNTIPRSQILDRLSSLGAPFWIVRWLLSYFTNRRQRVCLNGRCSLYLYNNVGVPQGAVLSPFLFSLHADSLSSRHSRMLKYAHDFVLCNSYSKCSDQEGFDDDLHRLVTWSADQGLFIDKTTCAECLFYPKNTSPQLLLSLINGEALSREQTVKYLGVHFNSNLTWSTHIDSVFTKCLKISFFIRRLRSMNVHKSLLWRIVSACAIPIILYCSPIISLDC